ncbi:MAG: ABC transporter permease [Acidobacteria bacterium]|nr:MAG: ABC transporter permease [Acidobacteriota bacterium]
MTLLARLRSWVRARLRRSHLEDSMQEEMRLHIELYEAELRRRGVSTAEARRRARAEFGSVEARKDECREAVGLRLLDELRGDVRYALRLLRRSPAFTAVALLSLGLGIGANTAIFSLIDMVLVKALPVADPQRLFFIDNSGGKSGGSSGPPYPCYERLRDHNRFLSGIAAFDENRFKVTIDGAPEQITGQYASGSYFDVLGIRAAHGRLLTPRDDSEFGLGGPDGAVAVISHALWRRRFAMDLGVLGKSIQVGTHWVTIVGVTPPEFFGLQVGAPIDVTIPMMLVGRNFRSRQLWWFSVVGRLEPDAQVEQARADLEALWDAYMLEIGKPRDQRGYFSGIALVPAGRGLDALRRKFSEPLLIAMTIVGVVLLIGCANIANLLLARASARRGEISVRLAIGAGRGRLIRQLITEGVVLASLGAVAGLLLGRWGVSLLLSVIGGNGGTFDLLEPRFDARVLAFTASVTLVTALLSSLAPALLATRIDAAKPAARTATSIAGTRSLLGRSLVVMQVMSSVTLLCGASLFVRTLQNLNAVESGFRREGVLTAQIEATIPGRSGIGFGGNTLNQTPKTPAEMRLEHARLGAIWEDFRARVSGLPDVTSAAVATMSPLTGRDRGILIAIGGIRRSEQDADIHINQVTAGYFETMGIDVLSGRAFTPRDRSASLRVAILNDTARRPYFGDENPIGKKVNFPGQRVEDEYEIVGVVSDTRYENLRTADERMVYVPIEQSIDPITNAMIAVRSPGDVAHVAPSIRSVASEIIPGAFMTRVATMDERVNASLVPERLLSMLASFFGVLALALACLGLYGVMAYGVLRRTREIAIRVAMGAPQQSVVWLIARETVALVVVGAALGTGAALMANRYIRSQLFGVTPGDPLAISIAILLLLVVAAAAGYVPARRATRVDPVAALRYE